MNIRNCAWFCVLMLVVGGCAQTNSQPDPRAQQFLGLYATNVLSRPTRVEGWTYRAADGTNIGTALPRTLDLSVARDLRQMLYNDESYRQLGRAGAFVRDAGFRVWSDNDSIEILVSFANDQLQLKTHSPGGQDTVEYASFAPVHQKMLDLVKRAFPEFRLK